MSYNPPSSDAIEFSVASSYTAPSSDAIEFDVGETVRNPVSTAVDTDTTTATLSRQRYVVSSTVDSDLVEIAVKQPDGTIISLNPTTVVFDASNPETAVFDASNPETAVFDASNPATIEVDTDE